MSLHREELNIAQKMFNQRLLAEHCWTEDQAQHIYTNEILPSSSSNNMSLIDTIKLCNSHLSDFGLEIVSITIPDYSKNTIPNDNDDVDDNNEAVDERPSSRRSSSSYNNNNYNNNSTTIKYYTMVNKFPDTITKDVYQNYLFQPLSLQSYVKQVLVHLVQQYPTPSSRATILNLKNTSNETLLVSSSTTQKSGGGDGSTAMVVPPAKVSLSNAEDMLERLIDEQWLIEVMTENRRTSSPTNAKIAIGPRALGELSYLLSSSLSTEEDDENDNTEKTSSLHHHHLKVLLPQPIYIRY